jgi:hypothetical protein
VRFTARRARAWFVVQGNRSGLVGCGFWNSDCGGLNLVLVWQIAYCIIFGLVVLVFPYMIFYYEADDEGSAAEEAARAAGGSTFMARLCDFRGCGKATVSALIYTAITVVISCIVLALMYVFLGKTEVPYKLTAVSVTSVAFMPLTTPIQASCAAGACLQPCGTGSCNWVSTTLSIDVRASAAANGRVLLAGRCCAVIEDAAALGCPRHVTAANPLRRYPTSPSPPC